MLSVSCTGVSCSGHHHWSRGTWRWQSSHYQVGHPHNLFIESIHVHWAEYFILFMWLCEELVFLLIPFLASLLRHYLVKFEVWNFHFVSWLASPSITCCSTCLLPVSGIVGSSKSCFFVFADMILTWQNVSTVAFAKKHALLTPLWKVLTLSSPQRLMRWISLFIEF